MNLDSFEKIDSDLMKLAEKLRETKVPENMRNDFSKSVEDRILRERRAPGLGWMLPSFALVFGLALAGAAAWFIMAPKQKPIAPVPVFSEPSGPPLAEFRESNIIQEIEALKELGLWTDEDEEAIGIPAEQAFSEMEIAFDDAGNQGPSITIAESSAQA